MELHTGDAEYEFSPSRYESAELGELDYTVQTVNSISEMEAAVEGTGSCLGNGGNSVMNGYLQTFSSSDNVHFYNVGDMGYARSVELQTTEGNAMAVDAVKTREGFDTRAYRAGVNSIMRHADAMNKDLVLGGTEFFTDHWTQDLDLTREDTDVTPAKDVFFDRTLSTEEIRVHHEEKPYTKGEQWDEHEKYFVRWI